jgi:uncharacterized membrane protein YgaE (UPF0421/DUF939 family)
MTLGARVLKTGISITLALYLCSLFNMSPGIYAAIAAAFTVQPTVYGSWRQVLDQVQTNTLGAILALGAIAIFGDEPFAIGIVSIIVIMISVRMKMENTIGLTLVTVLAIMEAPGDDLAFALNRFIIILAGMSSAFLVNLLILPPKHNRIFLDRVRDAFGQMSLLHRTAISNELTERAFKVQQEEFQQSLDKLDDLFGAFDEERRKIGRFKPTDIRQIVVFKQMLHALHKGNDVLEMIKDHYFRSQSEEGENQFFDGHLEYLSKYHEQLLLRYEGKLKDRASQEDDILNTSADFMKDAMSLYNERPEEQLGFVLVGSALFEYGYQLQRLEKVIEHYLNKKETASTE